MEWHALEAIVETASVLRVNETLNIEVLDLTTKLGGEFRGIEAVDERNSRLAREEVVVEHIGVVSEHRSTPKAGDDHTLFRGALGGPTDNLSALGHASGHGASTGTALNSLLNRGLHLKGGCGWSRSGLWGPKNLYKKKNTEEAPRDCLTGRRPHQMTSDSRLHGTRVLTT